MDRVTKELMKQAGYKVIEEQRFEEPKICNKCGNAIFIVSQWHGAGVCESCYTDSLGKEMKFYEQKEPYCLIKARNDEDMKLVFAREISEDIAVYSEMFQLKEVSQEDAYKTFSKATDEDGRPIEKAEIDEMFYSNVSEVLVVNRELI